MNVGLVGRFVARAKEIPGHRRTCDHRVRPAHRLGRTGAHSVAFDLRGHIRVGLPQRRGKSRPSSRSELISRGFSAATGRTADVGQEPGHVHRIVRSTGVGSGFFAAPRVGCVTDLKSRRIPNELVATILAAGLLFALTAPDVWPSLGMSLAGIAVGFGIWIAFYLVGAIGAGDVKFFAASGAWLGPAATWRAALVAALVGGVLAIATLIIERRLGDVIRRLALMASSGSLALLQPEGTAAPATTRPLPYGVALAIGALAVAWFPNVF